MKTWCRGFNFFLRIYAGLDFLKFLEVDTIMWYYAGLYFWVRANSLPCAFSKLFNLFSVNKCNHFFFYLGGDSTTKKHYIRSFTRSTPYVTHTAHHNSRTGNIWKSSVFNFFHAIPPWNVLKNYKTNELILT